VHARNQLREVFRHSVAFCENTVFIQSIENKMLKIRRFFDGATWRLR
jgi:hypothetical protein